MDDDKWITADARSGRLVIRFRVKGYPKQFFISSGLKDTKRNREIVRIKRDVILNAIALDRFDSTLESYQFGKKKLNKPIPSPETKYTLPKLWDEFTLFQESQIEQTTILNRYKAVARYIAGLPFSDLSQAVGIRDYLLKTTTSKMVVILINHFSQACEWGVKSDLISCNPFKDLRIKDKRKPKGNDLKAFTAAQRDLIINAFEVHPKFSYYTPLIKFLFYTGCRPGEAFALTWGDISEDCTKIKINKSKNLYRICKSTKNGVNRIFPTPAGSKLQKSLLTIKPDAVTNTQLVFPNSNGHPLNSVYFQKIWRGSSSRGYFHPGVVGALAEARALPYIKPYGTRHTFATLAIASGVTPDRVALWIGDTVQTVLMYYCHPEILNDECPDF